MKPKMTAEFPLTASVVKTKGLFEAVGEELRLRNYSPKTSKVYLGQLRAFVRFFKPRHPRELSNEDIRQYLLYLCLLYTSPSPRDATLSRMPSSA